ncbi:MAG: baseplate J/gp47 family protein [Pseudomonadota bacterium]
MSFSAINLAELPHPEIIAQIPHASLVAQRKMRLVEIIAEYDPALAAGVDAALALESDLTVKLFEEDAEREVHLRQAVQDAGAGNLLAFASGAVLDHLAAYWGIARQVVQEADPDASPAVPEVLESDDRLRRRVQLAPEAITTCGSKGSYEFWGLAASPEVKDVEVTSPAEGEVHVTVLSTLGNGTPSQELLAAVFATIDPRRDFCARFSVGGAVINHYSVIAELTLLDGPDAELVRQTSLVALEAHVAERHQLRRDITLSGLYGALWGAGIHDVKLLSPTADIVVESGHAPFCTSITLTVAGRNE